MVLDFPVFSKGIPKKLNHLFFDDAQLPTSTDPQLAFASKRYNTHAYCFDEEAAYMVGRKT